MKQKRSRSRRRSRNVNDDGYDYDYGTNNVRGHENRSIPLLFGLKLAVSSNYPTYRDRGLRISSAIESANFHVTSQRLKVRGTRWSETGAALMAALRADLFNGYWEKRTREVLAAAA